MTTGIRKVGDFCWINIITPKPADAREFFGKLLGWKFGQIGDMGDSIQMGGRDIGGLFDIDDPNTPPGTKPVIGVMMKVESADATAARVKELGGKAMDAFDIMEEGRMAVCFDPCGANFDVWEAKKGPGMDVDSSLHGAPSWFEVMTTDTDRIVAFYNELFGWKATEMPMPDVRYTTFSLDGTDVAGAFQITPEMGQMPSQWAVYFTVDDLDAASEQAVGLGGSISMPKKEIPGVGHICAIASPQGVWFYLIEYRS